MLGARDSSKIYENKVVSHRVVPESDLNVRQKNRSSNIMPSTAARRGGAAEPRTILETAASV